MCVHFYLPLWNHKGVSMNKLPFQLLQLATHATFHNAHPRAVAASGSVQDVSIHVVQSASHLGFIGKKLRGPVYCVLFS